MPERSEADYIVNDIIPLFTLFGYPHAGDSERVRVDSVPTFGATGKKSGSIDIVYYHGGEPLLLVEAKRKYKTHNAALKQAEYYILNFPKDKKEYARSGRRPEYIATAVGKEIKFWRHRFEISKNGSFEQISEYIISFLTFDELLEKYGLVKGYKPRILDAETFRIDFLNYLAEAYASEELLITPEVIKNVSMHILNFLINQKSYVLHPPYIELARAFFKQELIQDLHRRLDLIGSLGPKIARSYRSFILRAFQGTKLNQYLTEQCVISFMLNLIDDIESDWKVLDFECGSGGFLSAAAERGITIKNMMGIDIDNLPFIIAKTYLALYFRKSGKEIGNIPVKEGNGLFFHGNDWNLVIGNPAGSSRYEKNDLDRVLQHLERDLDQNGKDDIFSEYNFSIQQAIKSCKVGGKICLVLPEGFFSNSQDEFLRKYVAKHCRVLAIVSLPRGIFKKGRSGKTGTKGGQTASMKMSILFSEKIKPVINGTGIEIDIGALKYPVFMASISQPESVSGEVCEWLEERLDMLLKEWKTWKTKHELIKLA